MILVTLTRARSLDARARAWLLLVLPTMHGAWGWGFLTSRKALARASR